MASGFLYEPHQLDDYLPELLSKHQVPGLSIALIKDGGLFWSKGYGYKNNLNKQRITDQTIFEAASLSKPVVAYAALKLVQKGLLDLDSPLSAYLPEPYLEDDARIEQITARHVLCHTSGFPNWRWWEDDQKLTIKFTPGEKFQYSGEGYLYLQTVVERLTGTPLDILIENEVLKPFAMSNSSFVWKPEFEQVIASPHNSSGAPAQNDIYREPVAAYSLYTTAADYAVFISESLMRACRPPYPDERLIREMLKPQIPVLDTISWGLGWGLCHDGPHDAVWHWGDNGGYKNLAVGFKETGAGAVILTNGENGLKACLEIVNTLFYEQESSLKRFFDTFYGD
jgi:CubicO group peptidase (beta-lactamase class C family)